MIPFNKPYCSGRELSYMQEVCHSTTMSGNGQFTKLCHGFFEKRYGFRKCLLTTSGTDALEMCAMLCRLKPGDEVIVPSYTFVSSALAFLREGAYVRFADSGADNPNMTVADIEPLINERTRVIVVVHYAGVACDMDAIMALAEQHHLLVVEDAAHAIERFRKSDISGSTVCKMLFLLPKVNILRLISYHFDLLGQVEIGCDRGVVGFKWDLLCSVKDNGGFHY